MNNVSKNRQKKEQIVAELQKKVIKAKGMVFTNYQGLTHKQLEGLKRSAKTVDADFIAAKNTLLLLALEHVPTSLEAGSRNSVIGSNRNLEKGNSLEGPTAALFLYNDLVQPLKLLAKTIKELKLPVIKFGVLEGKLVSDTQILRIASLPPLPVLRAQLLGQMKAPISGLHRALSWNLQSFVMTLKAIENKKQG